MENNTNFEFLKFKNESNQAQEEFIKNIQLYFELNNEEENNKKIYELIQNSIHLQTEYNKKINNFNQTLIKKQIENKKIKNFKDEIEIEKNNKIKGFFVSITPKEKPKKNLSKNNVSNSKIRFYYYSDEKDSYFPSLKVFFENNDFEIDENIFNISIELGKKEAGDEFHDNFCYATYFIHITGARIDYNYYKPTIELLEKRYRNNLILIILVSGKYSKEFLFEDFKGIQINLKIDREGIYDDDSNKNSIKKICRSIKNKSLEP